MKQNTRILSYISKKFFSLIFIVIISACGVPPLPPTGVEAVYLVIEVVTPTAQLSTEPPQMTPTATETPATEPIATEPTPAEAPTLIVIATPQIAKCDCKRNVLRVNINLEVINGEPPYIINGESPVTRNNIIFKAIPGDILPVTVTDNNGGFWQDEIVVPNHCDIPTISCSGGVSSENNGTEECTEEEECTEQEVCREEELCREEEVCTEWAGNSGHCKEWKTEVVCGMQQVCDRQEVCTKVCR